LLTLDGNDFGAADDGELVDVEVVTCGEAEVAVAIPVYIGTFDEEVVVALLGLG